MENADVARNVPSDKNHMCQATGLRAATSFLCEVQSRSQDGKDTKSHLPKIVFRSNKIRCCTAHLHGSQLTVLL